MSALRSAAQRVVWEHDEGHLGWPLQEAITALRAAMVEDALQRFTDVNQELEAALAEPVQEPVAWMYDCGNGGRMYAEELDSVPGWMPLFTAPPQRKPLTEEEIGIICASLGFAQISPVEVARAIERAHGIVL